MPKRQWIPDCALESIAFHNAAYLLVTIRRADGYHTADYLHGPKHSGCTL